MPRVRAPACCDTNQAHGFVRAVEFHDEDMKPDPNGEYATKWEVSVSSGRGEFFTFNVKHCPICGSQLDGLDLVDVPEKSGLETPEL